MVNLKQIIDGFPKKYICVRNTILDNDNLIIEAEIIKVFDTLESAKDNASEIRRMMKKYEDFDIIYGDYDDYINTRKGKKINNHIDVLEKNNDKLTQESIDKLINKLKLN